MYTEPTHRAIGRDVHRLGQRSRMSPTALAHLSSTDEDASTVGYRRRVERLSYRHLGRDGLPAIERWFDDSATRRWLGGRDWPRRFVELATQPGRFAIVCLRGDEPVALLDVERYDDATAAIAIVVSPEYRGQAIGTTILRSIFDLTELDGVDQVLGEVQQGNAGGERLLRAAGFIPHAGDARDNAFSRWVLRQPQLVVGPASTAACASVLSSDR